MYNNSDGYILIDMKDVNMTLSTQHINGIFNRIVEVIDTNKLAVVINAGDNTPMAAIVHKKFNYYVINTTLYIFTINSNDIVIVEEAGEATVDVEIVPTLMSGTKIADFSIGVVTGELYAPTPTSEINDSVIAESSTWSSDKINTELSAKADSSSLASVATSGSYADLSNKPTIPAIDDTTTSQTSVWSSDKTAAEIAAGAGVTIDDTTTSLTKTWSSDKINTELSAKADSSSLASVATSGSYADLSNKPTIPAIDDTTTSQTSVWSSDKTSTELSTKANSSDVYTKTQVDNSLSGKFDKSKIYYGVGVTFDNNGVCTIDITSWGLSSRPETVFTTGCWAEGSIITYDRTNSTSKALKFFCYDTSNNSRRTGTNPFGYLVLL